MIVGVEVTRRCNLHCPHCFTDSGSKSPSEPSTPNLARLLEELAAAGVRSVAFSGGEPLIREDLPELIRAGKSTGISDLGLVTNGHFVTRENAHSLVAAGLSTVQVSLDGVDANDHCAIRNCGLADYYRALRAIRVFKDEGLRVFVATVISPANVRRAPEMALFCEALGIDGLRYCTFVPTGRAAQPEVMGAFSVAPEDMDGFIQFIRRLNASPGSRLVVSIDHAMGPWEGRGEFACQSGAGVAYVTVDGSLYPCPALIAEPFCVGNVFKTPVSELLASPRMAAARCVSREKLMGPCARCPNEGCSGGCRGSAYAATGSVFGSVAYCAFHRQVCF